VAALDHHFDDIARMHAHDPGSVEKLRDRGYAVGFIANVDKNFVSGDLENPAFEDFVAGRGREVAVIVQKMLVLFRIYGRDRCFKRSGHIVLYQGL
jgi:hypothetical protein